VRSARITEPEGSEPNYRPAILVAIASEATATLCLGLPLALTVRAMRSAGNAAQAPATHASCA